MKETGLMFKAPLVRAILAGQKTQTRRLVKPWQGAEPSNKPAPADLQYLPDFTCYRATCPYGQPGDRIYVRETFSHFERNEDFKDGCECFYRADGDCVDLRPWRPAIHMPKWAARIWLEITGVRVERLQDISEADADAEGCERLDTERYERDWKLCPKCGGTRLHDAIGAGLGVIHDVDCRECDTYVKRFRHLWESTGGDWAANPWVWVIDFKRIERAAQGEA